MTTFYPIPRPTQSLYKQWYNTNMEIALGFFLGAISLGWLLKSVADLEDS